MKIRISGNTIRYRLSKSDLDAFATTGLLEETTEFLQNQLQYKIVRIPGSDELTADFAHGCITLFVPEQKLNDWANTSMVGLQADMPLPNGKELSILLEKDFKCIDAGPKEDQSDFFENPAKAC